VDAEDLSGLDLSCWQVALCGAEPVHPKTIDLFTEKLEALNFDATAITPVYGLAEATLAVTFSNIEERPKCTGFDADLLENERWAVPRADGRQIASLGRALNCQLTIRDAAQRTLPEGQVGTVFVKGPGVMAGYLDRDEATRCVIDDDGWLNTGDSGFLYKGELYLCGREKDLIIIRGRNHDPALVEQALNGMPGIRTGCVAAFASSSEDADTEALVVVAEVRDEDWIDPSLQEDARRQIQAHTGLRVSSLALVAAGTLPRTSSGKIRRGEARRQFESGALSVPESVSLGLVVRENVRGIYHHTKRQIRRVNAV
jgi:acyl-CoA synthetase (AMP-forming)/AMP-acid ligase II